MGPSGRRRDFIGSGRSIALWATALAAVAFLAASTVAGFRSDGAVEAEDGIDDLGRILTDGGVDCGDDAAFKESFGVVSLGIAGTDLEQLLPQAGVVTKERGSFRLDYEARTLTAHSMPESWTWIAHVTDSSGNEELVVAEGCTLTMRWKDSPDESRLWLRMTPLVLQGDALDLHCWKNVTRENGNSSELDPAFRLTPGDEVGLDYIAGQYGGQPCPVARLQIANWGAWPRDDSPGAP